MKQQFSDLRQQAVRDYGHQEKGNKVSPPTDPPSSLNAASKLSLEEGACQQSRASVEELSQDQWRPGD